MKSQFIAVVCFFAALSFTSFVKGQNNNYFPYNILLQESRQWPRYIFLVKDTAYYERRQFDKPGYFTDYDTLIRLINCDCYQGRSTYLTLNNETISLTYNIGRDKGEKMFFSTANKKQIKKWNSFKNIDKYNFFEKSVRDLLKVNATNSEFYYRVKNEWRALLPLTSSLSQNDFDTELNKFKAKYLINK